ncbi:MAG: winged helix-turn-helix domain-containing protein [Chromatiaceae bacterium]|nr:winged helix-turn-helix domain-containing protein [Chromatiaceae bacterium]
MRYCFESLEIDSDALLLRVDGIELKVDVRCVELLVLLIEAWPGYCESTELLQQLWPRTIVTHWSLSRLVSDCRKTLKKAGYTRPCIQTIHGKGYRLAPELALGRFSSTPEASLPQPEPILSQQRQQRWLLPVVPLSVALISAFWWFPLEYQADDVTTLQISEAADSRARILWVDDNPQNNQRELAYLKQHQIAVYSVTNSNDALILLSLYHYDAVISDMGRADDPLAGLRLLQMMRDQGNNTAFYLYTVIPSAAKVELLRQYGAQGVATQPEQLYQYILTNPP